MDVKGFCQFGRLSPSDLHCVVKFLVDVEPRQKLLVAFWGGSIPHIFEIRVLTNDFIFLISSLDQIKRIRPEDPVQFGIDNRIDLLLEVLLEHLRQEIDHRLKKVLILKDKPSLSMTQQHSHIGKTYLLALLLKLMGFMDHQRT